MSSSGTSTGSSPRSGVRSGIVMLLLMLGLLMGAGVASAVPPYRIPDQITDRNDSIGGDTATVQNAIDKLYNEDKIQLWVVYVDSFDGMAGDQWAAQSAALSGFGSDTVLLAIATKDRAYGFTAPAGSVLSTSQLDTIAQNDIVPQLKASAWSGAAVAAADGLRTTVGGSSSSGSKTWILWVVLLGLLVGGLLWFRKARKSKSAAGPAGTASGGSVDGDGRPVAPAEPLEPLQSVSDRSVQILITTDNAVRTSEAQLNLAESTFGKPAMAEFRAAFEAARNSLAAAFQLRQQIDDDIPEDEATRRGWMNQIISSCTDADAALDAQSERFDDMLDLKNRLPVALTEIETAIAAQDTRVADHLATLARLGSTYAPSALSAVINNAAEAADRLDFARSSVVTARQEATAADTTPAVVAARSAQEAVAQSTTLLDAIDKLDANLADASAGLQARLAPVQAELATAKAAYAQGGIGGAGQGIGAQLSQVETALTAVAGPGGARDPILATQRIQEADQTLDQILAATRSAQQTQQRAGAALQTSLNSAEAKISGAGDFIATRKGAIGSEARTRLAEAQRHLANAQTLSQSDLAAALTESRQAEQLADEAARLAQNDVGRWQGPGGGGYAGRSGGGNSAFTGAILGGILGGLLNGGGGYGGGFGGGGFGGGGFGGGGGGFGGGGGGGGGSVGGRF